MPVSPNFSRDIEFILPEKKCSKSPDAEITRDKHYLQGSFQ